MTVGGSPQIAHWLTGTLRSAEGPVERWIVKFGGSLLTRPRWPQELVELVLALPGAVTIVAGGGPLVDGLRSIDAACPRPVEVTHALAIEAMGITARLVAEATGLPVVAAPSAAGGRGVLDVPAWLAEPERLGRLPVGWDVTSDSIAAAVACEAAAAILLAKRLPPPDHDLARLAAAGWIDGFMPAAARGVHSIFWAVPEDAA